MKIKVYSKNLDVAEEIELNSDIFDVKPEMELVQQAVKVQQANSRGSISNTKTRGEVRGGGKKPWKQKGTGRARAGSNRSPIWRHGGITFGPRSNRNYELKMNKKQWKKALYMTLTDKATSNNFLVFSDLSVATPKTKEMAAWLKTVKDKLATSSKKFLFILPKKEQNVEKSLQNLKYAQVIYANSLNVVDLMNCDSVVIPKHSLEIIEKTYSK
jgi:large subunit ribosomal protein L4